MDEYGGILGIVMLEDVMEVIVGDMEEVKGLKGIWKVVLNYYIIEGFELFFEVEEVLGVLIEGLGVYMLLGWMLFECFDLEVGDEIEYEGYCFIVCLMNKNLIW